VLSVVGSSSSSCTCAKSARRPESTSPSHWAKVPAVHHDHVVADTEQQHRQSERVQLEQVLVRLGVGGQRVAPRLHLEQHAGAQHGLHVEQDQPLRRHVQVDARRRVSRRQHLLDARNRKRRLVELVRPGRR
jgi:hypothetical protein